MYKTLLFSLCYCLFSVCSFAQQLPNYDFQNPTTQPCAYDSSFFEGFAEWIGYQTTDSNFWGPRDSHCIDIAVVPLQGLSINYDQVDHTYPMFVGSVLDNNTQVLLDSNGLYKMTLNMDMSGGLVSLLQGTNCPDGICTGIQIGIEIPDSTGNGHEVRWYTASATVTPPYLYVEFCFPTERFPNGNYLHRAYIKLTSVSSDPGMRLESYGIYLEDMTPYTEKVRQVDAYFNGTNYEFRFNTFSNWMCFCSNKMMMYNDTTHPGPAHQSYVEVAPSPNVTTQELVDVFIDFDATLIYQPYTQMRGGLVQGDTLRHIVNLINNGGTICMYPFVDLVFQNGNGYTHRSGKLSMEGQMACMQFGRGSALTVSNGSHFEYGRPGNGMLALRSDGKIVLEHKAEFWIHNTFAFGEYHEDNGPGIFEIHLKPGSKFVFGPEATLTNMISRFPEASFLDVYMEGGTLDDSQLSEEERRLIRRIYTSPSATFEDNLTVLGNPFHDQLELTFVSSADMPLEVALLSLDGQQLMAFSVAATKGTNYLQIPVAELANGMYLVRATTPYASCTKRVLKAE